MALYPLTIASLLSQSTARAHCNTYLATSTIVMLKAATARLGWPALQARQVGICGSSGRPSHAGRLGKAVLLRILLLLLRLWCVLVLHGLPILLVLHLLLLLLPLPWVLLIMPMHSVLSLCLCGRPLLLLQPRTL